MNETTGSSTVIINTDRNNKGKLKIKCNTNRNGTFDMAGGTFIINNGDARTLEIDGKRLAGDQQCNFKYFWRNACKSWPNAIQEPNR